ncbi:hypothetical protein CALCODRAFT_489114, partial [Calocera cornea HHB12733]
MQVDAVTEEVGVGVPMEVDAVEGEGEELEVGTGVERRKTRGKGRPKPKPKGKAKAKAKTTAKAVTVTAGSRKRKRDDSPPPEEPEEPTWTKRLRANYSDARYHTIHDAGRPMAYRYSDEPSLLVRSADPKNAQPWSVEQLGNAVLEGATIFVDDFTPEQWEEDWEEVQARYNLWLDGKNEDGKHDRHELVFCPEENARCGWAFNQLDWTAFAQRTEPAYPHRAFAPGVPANADNAIVWWAPITLDFVQRYVLPEDRGQPVAVGEVVERAVDFEAERYKRLEVLHGGPLYLINAWWAYLLMEAHTHFAILAVNTANRVSKKFFWREWYPSDLSELWAFDFDLERYDLFRPLPFKLLRCVWLRCQRKVRDLIGLGNFFEAISNKTSLFTPDNLPAVKNFIGVLLPRSFAQKKDRQALLDLYFRHGVPVLEPTKRHVAMEKNPNAHRRWEDENHTRTWVLEKRKEILLESVALGGTPFDVYEKLELDAARDQDRLRSARRANPKARADKKRKVEKKKKKIEEDTTLSPEERQKKLNELRIEDISSKLRTSIQRLNFPGESKLAGVLHWRYRGMPSRMGEIPFDIDYAGKKLAFFLHPEL